MPFSPSAIEVLLDRFYAGPIKRTDQAFVIRCPWHSDANPSCNIFSKSGVFFCWRCHFGKNKGVSALEGFKALGVPDSELEKVKQQEELRALEFKPQTIFFEESQDQLGETPNPSTTLEIQDQVILREDWPKFWAFRQINYSTFEDPKFQERFTPSLVTLSTKLGPERLPRLSLSLANLRGNPSEVYLRLSSEQQPKAVNARGLDLTRSDLLPLGFPPSLLSSSAWPSFIILVEGPYDALRSYQHLAAMGLSTKVEVGAILGTGQWGHAWRDKFLLDYLQKFKGTLVLAFDADEAGFQLTRQVIIDLSMYISKDRLKILNWKTPAKDPGDLSLEGFKEAWLKHFRCDLN